MAKIKIRKRKQVGEWTDQAKVAALSLDPDVDFEQTSHFDFCKQRVDAVLAELAENMKWVPTRILGDHGPLKLLGPSEDSSDQAQTETTE